jgi:alpha-N-arabinofuranosidase
VFEKAIKNKYPSIKIVSGTGPFPAGELFDFATAELKTLKADIVDEHYYAKPEWFFENVTRYDKYDRNGPKIFAGEYAAQSVATVSPDNKNNWRCALSEAAFMTGLERNADVVQLCSYAPLLAHAEGWQWTPDLIWFDNLKSFATPNYHVQRLYANNKGTHGLSIKRGTENVAGQNDLYASAVWDAKSKEIIVKIVNNSSSTKATEIDLAGGKKFNPNVRVVSLNSSADETNTFDNPENIKPLESSGKINGKKVSLSLKPYSLTVVKVQAR